MNAAMFHIYLNNLFENLRHYQIAGTRGKTVAYISKRLGLPYMTVRNALLRFVNAGHLW